MYQDLVSINITTFNRANLLSRCLDSVLKQTYKNIEIIIVDDASSDKTGDVVKSYQAEHSNIKYFSHSLNQGNAEARNTAFKKCKGTYVAFMDDDDEWIDDDKISKQVKIFNQADKNLGIVCSGIIRHLEDGSEVTENMLEISNVQSRILKGGWIHNSTVLTKRSILNDLNGFNTEIPRGVDYEFFIRVIAKYNFKVFFMQDITCKYYENSPNRMTDKRNTIEAISTANFVQVFILKKYFKYYIKSPSALLNRLLVILKIKIKLLILRISS